VISRIVITSGGTERSISVADWRAMALTERIALLSSDSVRFYDGSTQLSAREALAVLKSSA
jgi:hypothetical protein